MIQEFKFFSSLPYACGLALATDPESEAIAWASMELLCHAAPVFLLKRNGTSRPTGSVPSPLPVSPVEGLAKPQRQMESVAFTMRAHGAHTL